MDKDRKEVFTKWHGLHLSATEQEFEENWVLFKAANNETGYANLQSTWIPHKKKP